MKRTIILLLDSLGIGGAEDADIFIGINDDGENFDDAGANTLGHIAQACASGAASNGRTGPLTLPNMNRLGIGRACVESSGYFSRGVGRLCRTCCRLRLCEGALDRQGYLLRPLGDDRRAGIVRVGLLYKKEEQLPPGAAE